MGNSSRSEPRWVVAALLLWAAGICVLHFIMTPGWLAVWSGLAQLVSGQSGGS